MFGQTWIGYPKVRSAIQMLAPHHTCSAIRPQHHCVAKGNLHPLKAFIAPHTRSNAFPRAACCQASSSKHSNASAFASTTIAASLLLSSWLQPGAAFALPESQLNSLRSAIEKDFSQSQYYVTGKLTTSLYDEKCTFKDPTTNVHGVEPYTRAVAALFDPAVSHADLLSSSVSGPNSITLKWRLEGRLKIGNLPIKPYTGTTVYTVDEGSGLITRHDETWDISALDAFVSTLIPGFGAPPAPPV